MRSIEIDAGEIAARPIEARYKTKLDWVDALNEEHGNRGSCVSRGLCGPDPSGGGD